MRAQTRRIVLPVQQHMDMVVSTYEQALDVGEQLFSLVDLLESQPRIKSNMTDLTCSNEVKKQFIDDLLGAHASPVTLSVINELLEYRWTRQDQLVKAVDALAVFAVLAAAEHAGRIAIVEDEVFRFSRYVAHDRQLRYSFLISYTGQQRKLDTIDMLLAEKAQPETILLVKRATLSPLGRHFDHVLAEVVRAAAARRHQVPAWVRVGIPLTKEQQHRLTHALEEQYGQSIHLVIDVDPSVVAGIHIRIGEDSIDGTLFGQMTRMRKDLAALHRSVGG